MTLWQILLGFAFAMPPAGAISVALDGHATPFEAAAGITASLILGAFFSWTMYAIGRKVVTELESRPEGDASWPFRFLYVGAAVWVIVGFVVGLKLAEFIFRYS